MITSRIFYTYLISTILSGVKFKAEFKYVMFLSVGTFLVWLIYYFLYLYQKTPYGVSVLPKTPYGAFRILRLIFLTNADRIQGLSFISLHDCNVIISSENFSLHFHTFIICLTYSQIASCCWSL